jgi:HSP20 family molecular chaperone IbpA
MFVVPFTTTVRRDPRQFARLIDDSLDHFFGSSVDKAQAARSPALDLVESDARYTVTLDMPAFRCHWRLIKLTRWPSSNMAC